MTGAGVNKMVSECCFLVCTILSWYINVCENSTKLIYTGGSGSVGKVTTISNWEDTHYVRLHIRKYILHDIY